jgi:hypothetical protein
VDDRASFLAGVESGALRLEQFDLECDSVHRSDEIAHIAGRAVLVFPGPERRTAHNFYSCLWSLVPGAERILFWQSTRQ